MNILMTLDNAFTDDPRVYNEAKSLVKKGHKVTVLAWDKKKQNIPYETKEGINIVRSYNTKIMNLLPYNLMKLQFWWNKGYNDALKLYEKEPYDLIHCHDLSSLPIGVKLKKKLDLPLIYDAHEIWGYMVAKKLHKIMSNYYLWKEKKLLKYVDEIITVNEILWEYFKKITDKSITIIMNCKPIKDKTYEPTKNKKMTVLYIGGLYEPRFLLELVDVIKDIPDVHAIIVGYRGEPDYIETLKNKSADTKNVDFIRGIPLKDVLPMTKKADVIFHMVDPRDLNNRIGTGNKQFEAMVCGRPIISTKGTNDGDFVEKGKRGLTIEYTKEALKQAIITLRDNPKLREEMGRNALELALKRYNWEKQEEKLIQLYENLGG
jgi:glycosyltransferase involved in cell wall biosynthesis